MTKDAEIMHGVPVFRGTLVPVQNLFDYLEGGETIEDFLEGFPAVSRSLARLMRLLLDECVDERLRDLFSDHDCQTAHHTGFAGLRNGQLLDAAETPPLMF